MRAISDLEKRWKDKVTTGSIHPAVALDHDGLVLGAGTGLMRMVRDPDGAETLDLEGDHDRLIALLTVAFPHRVPPNLSTHVAGAAGYWKRGDKGLANIRLGLARLPRLASGDDAYRLFLAGEVLDAGLAPGALLKELGLRSDLLKYPGQPRVPNGQFDFGRAPAAAPVVPVRMFNEMEDPEGKFSDYEERRAVGAETFEEDLEHGHPLQPIPRAGGVVTAPTSGASGGNATVVVPDKPASVLPSPAGSPKGGPKNSSLASPADEDKTQRKGLDCPPAMPDVEHYATPAAKKYQAFVNSIINPSDPTPNDKAYYLPNPSAGGRLVSYDDCDKTDEPNGIPGMIRGDMVEAKSKRYDFLLINTMKGKNKTWSKFVDQVRRQNEAIAGTSRKVFYCFEGLTAAEFAKDQIGKRFPESVFIQCD